MEHDAGICWGGWVVEEGSISVDQTSDIVEGGPYFVSGPASLNACSRWRKLITKASLRAACVWERLHFQLGSCFCQNLLCSCRWFKDLLYSGNFFVHQMWTKLLFRMCFKNIKFTLEGQDEGMCRGNFFIIAAFDRLYSNVQRFWV